MDKENLRSKAISGIAWSSVQRFGAMAITFASNIILARLLSPDDFGCVGMLMVFISLSNTFIDGGFGSALIQKKSPNQEDYSTIFFWNIFLSIVLYILLFFSSSYISKFYNLSKLTVMLQVQGLVLILNAFSIIQQNILRKRLLFKKLAIVVTTSSLISLVIAIIAAYKGLGAWSLIIQQLCIALFNAILFWMVSNWRPIWIFSKKSFHELFSFGGFILLSNLFNAFSNEVQGLLVGKMFTPATMGLYTQAYRLEGTSAHAASTILDQVTYPVLSSLQNDRQSLLSALRRFTKIPAFICSPLMALLIIIAKPLIIFLFTEKWVGCVPYFQILCVGGVAVSLQGIAVNAISAIGRSDISFKWTIIKRTLTIILCVLGIYVDGMIGLLWGCVLGAWSVFFIHAYLTSKFIGYKIYQQIFDILPFIIFSIICGAIAYYSGYMLNAHILFIVIYQTFCLLGIYLLLIYFFRIETGQYLLNLLKAKFRKNKVHG